MTLIGSVLHPGLKTQKISGPLADPNGIFHSITGTVESYVPDSHGGETPAPRWLGFDVQLQDGSHLTAGEGGHDVSLIKDGKRLKHHPHAKLELDWSGVGPVKPDVLLTPRQGPTQATLVRISQGRLSQEILNSGEFEMSRSHSRLQHPTSDRPLRDTFNVRKDGDVVAGTESLAHGPFDQVFRAFGAKHVHKGVEWTPRPAQLDGDVIKVFPSLFAPENVGQMLSNRSTYTIKPFIPYALLHQ